MGGNCFHSIMQPWIDMVMVCPYLDIAWPYLVALANLSNGLWILLLFRFLWRFFEQHVQLDPRRCCSADVGALDFLFFSVRVVTLFVRNVVVYRNVCWRPVQLCVALIIFSTGSACALNYLSPTLKWLWKPERRRLEQRTLYLFPIGRILDESWMNLWR